MIHAVKRNVQKWGSCGKFHDEPMMYRLIKDLSDSHLSHIIPWIKKYKNAYSDDTITMMTDEQEFRCENYIFVQDYKTIE